MTLFALGDIIDWVTTPFTAAAGWAWETVTEGLTAWVGKAFVGLLTLVWRALDSATSPRLDAEWFSGGPGSPYGVSVTLGVAVLLLAVFGVVIGGVASGSPGEIARRVVVGVVSTVWWFAAFVALTQVGLDLVDAVTADLWDMNRDTAAQAVDNIAIASAALSGSTFLSVFVFLVGMVAVLFLFVVMLVRGALLFVTAALAPLVFAARVWPALTPVLRQFAQLHGALILAKLPIALALTVGFSAVAGVGGTGQPGEGTTDNALAETSTVLLGVVVLGVAAFMPFLLYQLFPVVTAAAVGQGVASAPLRGAAQAAQLSYYGQRLSGRLAGGRPPGPGPAPTGPPPPPPPTGPERGPPVALRTPPTRPAPAGPPGGDGTPGPPDGGLRGGPRVPAAPRQPAEGSDGKGGR